jgi:hypothetical protein
MVSTTRDDAVVKFMIAEYVHYATPASVVTPERRADPDRDYMHTLFHVADNDPCVLPTTEELYGPVRTNQCRFCGSLDTLTSGEQRRSMDEPTNFYTRCITCSRVSRTG